MNETIKYQVEEEKSEDYQLKAKSTIRIGEVQRDLFAGVGLNISIGSLIIYKNIIMKGIKYDSQISKEISTIDHFVRLNDGQIASIVFFTVLDSKLYALVDIFEPNTPTNDHLIRIKSLD